MTTTAPAPLAVTRPNTKRFIAIAAATVAVDLGSKIAATATLDEPIRLGPITLRISHNSGVAFGAGNGLPAAVVIAATALVTIVLVIAVLRGHLGTGPGPAMVTGGAAANVIDRSHNASVVDMIDLGWWPSFNLADTAICIGLALIILTQRRLPDHNRHTDEPASQ